MACGESVSATCKRFVKTTVSWLPTRRGGSRYERRCKLVSNQIGLIPCCRRLPEACDASSCECKCLCTKAILLESPKARFCVALGGHGSVMFRTSHIDPCGIYI